MTKTEKRKLLKRAYKKLFIHDKEIDALAKRGWSVESELECQCINTEVQYPTTSQFYHSVKRLILNEVEILKNLHKDHEELAYNMSTNLLSKEFVGEFQLGFLLGSLDKFDEELEFVNDLIIQVEKLLLKSNKTNENA